MSLTPEEMRTALLDPGFGLRYQSEMGNFGPRATFVLTKANKSWLPDSKIHAAEEIARQSDNEEIPYDLALALALLDQIQS